MRAAALLALAACTSPALDEAETSQAMAVCADGPTVYGIDVSRFQGAIDWDQVAASGVVFSYIQISRSLTDLDARFDTNWRRAREVGILRGAYQRFQPDQDVLGQADIFLAKLGAPQPGDLPPMLDVEDAGGLPGPVIAERVRQWVERVEPVVGLRPIIYTGFYFWRDQVGGADLTAHPLWIANYSAVCPLVPAPWTRWTFHQYASTAVIPGITANTVDVNKFNGTLDELRALADPSACGAACPDPSGPDHSADFPPDDPLDDASGAGCTAGHDRPPLGLALAAFAAAFSLRASTRRSSRRGTPSAT